MTPAGRPREFEIDDALEAAMNAFWLHGYETTSMADLVEATGVKKGSLYKAFGGKHSLFVHSLKRYMDQMEAEMRPLLMEAPNATEAVRRWIGLAQCTGTSDECPRGCMIVNTISELMPHDPVIQGMLQEHIQHFMAMITDLVRRGQASGEFRTDIDAESLAEFLSTVGAGIVMKSKTSVPAQGSVDLADVVLESLKPR